MFKVSHVDHVLLNKFCIRRKISNLLNIENFFSNIDDLFFKNDLLCPILVLEHG